ncbi:MAG: glycosyltransferase [Clostridia bacterium]|nr:glycosyltransferase [Clostridia bacterium]
MIKVSIIVPVYNVKDYLEECLNSLVNQTLSDIEIVLVNDGSTDGSDVICEHYASEYKNVTYITQQNQGQSVARNVGVSRAIGEYILFVDSDDYVVLNACERLYNTAVQTGADIVSGDILNEKDKIDGDSSFRRIDGVLSTIDYADKAIEIGAYDIVPWLRLVKRSYLIENGISFLEGCFYEDQEYTLKLFTKDLGTAVKLQFPFYYYRMTRAGSTTNHTSLKKSTDFLKVLSSMHAYVKGLEDKALRLSYKVLGIAYYHFVSVWLKQERKYLKGVRKEFINLINSCEFANLAINTLPSNLKKTVVAMIKRPKTLILKYGLRNFLKRFKG